MRVRQQRNAPFHLRNSLAIAHDYSTHRKKPIARPQDAAIIRHERGLMDDGRGDDLDVVVLAPVTNAAWKENGLDLSFDLVKLWVAVELSA